MNLFPAGLLCLQPGTDAHPLALWRMFLTGCAGQERVTRKGVKARTPFLPGDLHEGPSRVQTFLRHSLLLKIPPSPLEQALFRKDFKRVETIKDVNSTT